MLSKDGASLRFRSSLTLSTFWLTEFGLLFDCLQLHFDRLPALTLFKKSNLTSQLFHFISEIFDFLFL